MQKLNPALFRATSGEVITRDNVDALLDRGAIQVRMNRDLSDGSPRFWTIRRNGATKKWKRDPLRLRIPFKMGLYGHGAITETDFVS